MQKLAFLANPMTMVQGVQDWLFGAPPNDGSDIGDFGPVYGLSVAALIAVSVTLLLARYRKVSS
jgi:ABC-2 type transport system permease protein